MAWPTKANTFLDREPTTDSARPATLSKHPSHIRCDAFAGHGFARAGRGFVPPNPTDGASPAQLPTHTLTPCRRRHDDDMTNARRKASRTAIERSVFSACMFELEDQVLMEIVKSFEVSRWVVSSFQFDGLHVEHRSTDTVDENGRWAQVEATMREAEQAVESKLGYKISLVEKALFTAPTRG